MSEAGGRETLQRLESWLWPSFLKRVGLAQADFGPRTGIPINISSKGHRVFRFFLNPRGFGTGRNQPPPAQQCPPRSHCGPAPPGGLLGRGKSCCFSLVATSLPATTFGTLSGLWSGGVGILSSNLSPSYYMSKNQKGTHQSIIRKKPLLTFYFTPCFFLIWHIYVL